MHGDNNLIQELMNMKKKKNSLFGLLLIVKIDSEPENYMFKG